MKSFIKRIDALERRTAVIRRVHQRISELALGGLSEEHLESLISAYGADRQGRVLTEQEVAARAAYGAAFEREYQPTHLRAARRFATIPDIHVVYNAMMIATSRRFSGEQLELVVAASQAQERGRQPTERESSTLQACNECLAHLFGLAGFASRAEFELAKGGLQ